MKKVLTLILIFITLGAVSTSGAVVESYSQCYSTYGKSVTKYTNCNYIKTKATFFYESDVIGKEYSSTSTTETYYPGNAIAEAKTKHYTTYAKRTEGEHWVNGGNLYHNYSKAYY